MEKCLHKNFKVITTEICRAEEGYEEAVESEDFDLANYAIGESYTKEVCLDCRKTLEEW